jgi:hypothetical protein
MMRSELEYEVELYLGHRIPAAVEARKMGIKPRLEGMI